MSEPSDPAEAMMERVRVARAILVDAKPPGRKTRRDEQIELAAFMAIFHPTIDADALFGEEDT